MTEDRDPKDLKWRAVRFAAFKRDDFFCQRCGSKQKLNGHHIVRWADNEKLRYVVSNIITLCEQCHEFVTGREDEFREEFQRAVAMRTDKNRVDKRMKKALSFKHNYKPKNPHLRY